MTAKLQTLNYDFIYFFHVVVGNFRLQVLVSAFWCPFFFHQKFAVFTALWFVAVIILLENTLQNVGGIREIKIHDRKNQI